MQILKSADNQGFSLIEIIVALSILATAYVAAVSAFPMGLSINHTANFNSVAAFLAQQQIETLNSVDYSEIATGTIEILHPISTSTSDSLSYFQRQTVVSYIDGNLMATTTDLGMKKIQTSVFYTDPVTKNTKSFNITIINSEK